MLKDEQPARLVLPQAEVQRELHVTHGLLELHLDLLRLHLGVVEILESGERATHRAGNKHQRLVAIQQLDRLGSLAGQREVPRFTIIRVHHREVQRPGRAQPHFSDQLRDPGRRVDLTALGSPLVCQQHLAIRSGLRHLELLLLAQVMQDLPNGRRPEQRLQLCSASPSCCTNRIIEGRQPCFLGRVSCFPHRANI